MDQIATSLWNFHGESTAPNFNFAPVTGKFTLGSIAKPMKISGNRLSGTNCELGIQTLRIDQSRSLLLLKNLLIGPIMGGIKFLERVLQRDICQCLRNAPKLNHHTRKCRFLRLFFRQAVTATQQASYIWERKICSNEICTRSTIKSNIPRSHYVLFWIVHFLRILRNSCETK